MTQRMSIIGGWIIALVVLTCNSYGNDLTRKREYLSLSVGLTHDQKLPFIPTGADYSGDWRECTKLTEDVATSTIRFEPTKEGSCSLLIFDAQKRKVFEFFLTVKRSNLNHIAREIKSLLGDVEGINIKMINNKVVIDGQILLPRDMSRIYSVCSEYGENCSSLVTLSPLAQKKLAKYIERDINNPEISVRAVNDKFILEGQANDEGEKAKAEIIAKTYVPDIVVDKAEAGGVIKKYKVNQVVINLLTVKSAPPPEPGKIIQLVVHYVELKKDYNKGHRFQWTPTIGDGSSMSFNSGDRGVAGVVSQITGTINNLLPRLNWAKAHGYARVLQSTSIIVQDGNQGSLKSMTRIPYNTVNAQGMVSTNFEEAGINTTITPRVMGSRSDTIHLTINFIVKSLLNVTDSGPVVSDSNLNTVIMVRSGESAAIGGLVQSSSGTDYNKMPQNAPQNPLFSLYSSKYFRKDQSQFVVFITPLIKASASEGSDRIKRKVRLLN